MSLKISSYCFSTVAISDFCILPDEIKCRSWKLYRLFWMWLKRSCFSGVQINVVKATFPFRDCIGCFTDALVLTWSYYRVSCLQHTHFGTCIIRVVSILSLNRNETFYLITTNMQWCLYRFFSEISFAPAIVFPPQTTWHLRVEIRLWNYTTPFPITLLHMALYNKLCFT